MKQGRPPASPSNRVEATPAGEDARIGKAAQFAHMIDMKVGDNHALNVFEVRPLSTNTASICPSGRSRPGTGSYTVEARCCGWQTAAVQRGTTRCRRWVGRRPITSIDQGRSECRVIEESPAHFDATGDQVRPRPDQGSGRSDCCAVVKSKLHESRSSPQPSRACVGKVAGCTPKTASKPSAIGIRGRQPSTSWALGIQRQTMGEDAQAVAGDPRLPWQSQGSEDGFCTARSEHGYRQRKRAASGLPSCLRARFR